MSEASKLQHIFHVNLIFFQGSTKNRVVTLEGQLIDISGTMSGGGAKAARGGMSAKVVEEFSPQEIATFESTYAADNAKLQSVRASKRECEARVRSFSMPIFVNDSSFTD